MGASDLSASITKINKDNNDILDYNTIGLSFLDYEIFEENKYCENSSIFIDEKKDSYKLMNFPSLGMSSGYGLMNPKVYFQALNASRRGFKGNMQGDGFQLGGTVIMDKEGNILYSHRQSSYTDYPPEEDISQVVKNYKFTHLY